MTEQRHFRRVAFVTKSDVTLAGRTKEARLVDISLKGALVEFQEDVAVAKGSRCGITVHLQLSELALSFEGVMVHAHGRIAGIKFTKTGIDTMMHLRRLLELNTADGDLVRSELEALLEAE